MKPAFSVTIFLSAIGLTNLGGSTRADDKDDLLRELLKNAGFTGKIEQKFHEKLGRPLNGQLVDLGRLVFFGKGLGVQTNSCSGCHSPTTGFGDTQPIAIGIGNNNKVGPSRTGARNQRRSP